MQTAKTQGSSDPFSAFLRNLKRTDARRASTAMARGPCLEAQHHRCALQAAPFGAYGLPGNQGALLQA